MILSTESAETVANYLLQIKAIKLQPKNPFTWASGLKSPIYCDNRIILSHPVIRTYIRHEIAKIIEGDTTPDVIVGVATGGIAIGALVAEELGLPFAYVRASGKDHGMKNQIEGEVRKGQKILVIEDLISSGGSSLAAVSVLREAGCEVKNMIAIFTYGFEKAQKAFEENNVHLVTLSDYPTLLKKALSSEYITEDELEQLADWRKDPAIWSNTFQ